VPIRVGLQLHETEPVKKAVEANLGVGLVSAHAITREVASGHLATAAIDGLEIERHLEMVSRRDKYFSPMALRFREFARAFLARL